MSTLKMRNNNGFTLIEVILALVITAMGVTIVAQGFDVGGRASVSAQYRTKAVWLAEMKMTEIEIGEIAVNIGDQGTFDDNPLFQYTIESDTTDHTNLYEVNVTIIWEERNAEHSYTLTRLYYQAQEEEQ